MVNTEGNTLFPIFVKIGDVKTLIVGGGYVGLEKLEALLKNNPNANVRLVAIEIREEVKELVKEHSGIELINRAFEEKDLEGVDMAVLATADRDTNLKIREISKSHQILTNVADTPDLCDFYLGSTVKKGDLKIGISTNGKSPTFSKRFREVLEETLPDETNELLDNLKSIRDSLGGDFNHKVKELNRITETLKPEKKEETPIVVPTNYAALNEKYEKLGHRERIEELFKDFNDDKILMTSSFGSTAVILLHMISQIKPDHPVYFLDTTYHFDETLEYRKVLEERLGLKILELKAPENRNGFTRENLTYHYNQNLCCYINKVAPLDSVKKTHEIWISGLLRFQNENRSKLGIFDKRSDIVKFHPIIDMTREEASLYLQIYDLPVHPLVEQGYDSIGCKHCTVKGNGRTGRWMNTSKNGVRIAFFDIKYSLFYRREYRILKLGVNPKS